MTLPRLPAGRPSVYKEHTNQYVKGIANCAKCHKGKGQDCRGRMKGSDLSWGAVWENSLIRDIEAETPQGE